MSAEDRRRSAFMAFMDAFKPGAPGVSHRLRALPRMLKASLKGEYDGGKRLLLMAGAVLYVISPLDALPELVFLAFGLIDDAFVVTWLIGTLIAETDRFLEWEKAHGRGPSVIPSDVVNP